MKTHRWIIFVSVILCVLSLVLSLFFYDPISSKTSPFRSFTSALFMGVFSSGIVVILTSLLSYFVQRGKAVNALVARIVKIQSKFGKVHRKILEMRDATSEQNASNIRDKDLMELIDKLRIALLWTPRNERISWYTSSKIPPNQVFSTHLQRLEFAFVNKSIELINICDDYWSCYNNSRATSPETQNSGENRNLVSGCRSTVINYFLSDNNFICASNDYLGYIKDRYGI